jgi:transcriptional regulator with XRE-family HTH domain
MMDQPPSEAQASRPFKRTPEIEVAIGARLKILRLAAGLSQNALGEAIGITFQQIQKYEKGQDRVAASTLQVLAGVLKVHPGSFFDGEMTTPTGDDPDVRTALKEAAGLQRIYNPKVRKQLSALIEALADKGDV